MVGRDGIEPPIPGLAENCFWRRAPASRHSSCHAECCSPCPKPSGSRNITAVDPATHRSSKPPPMPIGSPEMSLVVESPHSLASWRHDCAPCDSDSLENEPPRRVHGEIFP